MRTGVSRAAGAARVTIVLENTDSLAARDTPYQICSRIRSQTKNLPYLTKAEKARIAMKAVNPTNATKARRPINVMKAMQAAKVNA